MQKKNEKNWIKFDEKALLSSDTEWWCIVANLTTLEDNSKWSIKSGFIRWVGKENRYGSVYSQTLFDIENDIYYYFKNIKKKQETKEKDLDIKFEKSYIKGLFPNYETHIFDTKNDIELKLKCNCKSQPKFIAEDITNGWIPFGLGFYRYIYIPTIEINGNIRIKNNKFNVNGIGYFEHVWGDFSFAHPFAKKKDLKKTISCYAKLFRWWKNNHKFSFPKSLTFTSENNPFGYDWIWASTDNSCSIFFGNTRFWLEKGPVMGILLFTEDGNNYTEFCDMNFEYKSIKYSKEFEFYYPTEIEIHAKKGKEIININCKNLTNVNFEVNPVYNKKLWKSYIISEAPCEIKCNYYNNNKKRKIQCYGKMESQRLLSVFGHSKLKFDILHLPEVLGIKLDYISHYYNKNMKLNLQFLPKPRIKINMTRINKK